MGKVLNDDELDGVDKRLVEIVTAAAAASPFDVQINDGMRSGGKGNHKHGYAIDVQLIEPGTGKKLPNKMYYPGTKKVIPGARDAYPAYEQFAQTARVYQHEKHPKLDSVFRWGGGFRQGGTPFDMMHFDITPKAKGAMAYYNWDTGLTAAGKAAQPKLVSNGGLGGTTGSRRVAQYQQALKGGPLPSGNIPGVASLTDTVRRPSPATMSAATAAKRQPVIASAYDSPRSNAAVMALYAGILPATPASPAPAPKAAPVASPLTVLTGSAQRKPVASGVGGANIAGAVALPKGVVPKAATAAMEQAKAAAGVKPAPKPPVPGLIKLVDPSAKKSGLASVPAGMPLNSGSRDSVANRAAGRTAAAAGMAATAVQKQQAAEQARQRAAEAQRQQIQIASRARAEAARAASLRAAQQVASRARTAVAEAARTGGVVIDNAVYGSGGTSYGSNVGQVTAGLKPGDRTYNPDTNSWGLKV